MTDEERRLKYLLKQANKIMGRQGQTIHQLRAELAEVRELHSKIDRGLLRSLERTVVNDQERLRIAQDHLATQTKRLRIAHDHLRLLQAKAPEVADA